MAVLQYQLVIIASILGLTYVQRKYGLYAAIAWTLWSLALLHEPSLIAIQSSVIWASWFGATRFFKKQNNPKELSSDSHETPHVATTSTHERIATTNSIVRCSNHARELREAFAIASTEILIVSGWISDKVVNDHFCSLLTRALDRGVDVHIAYGASEWNGPHKISATGQRALEKMQKAAEKSKKGRLIIVQRPTHEKLLAVDDQYAIVGSFNWLSNTRLNDKETSIKTNQREVIASLIDSSKNAAARHTHIYGGN